MTLKKALTHALNGLEEDYRNGEINAEELQYQLDLINSAYAEYRQIPILDPKKCSRCGLAYSDTHSSHTHCCSGDCSNA